MISSMRKREDIGLETCLDIEVDEGAHSHVVTVIITDMWSEYMKQSVSTRNDILEIPASP